MQRHQNASSWTFSPFSLGKRQALNYSFSNCTNYFVGADLRASRSSFAAQHRGRARVPPVPPASLDISSHLTVFPHTILPTPSPPQPAILTTAGPPHDTEIQCQLVVAKCWQPLIPRCCGHVLQQYPALCWSSVLH